MDPWETARRMICEYGKGAEDECSARAHYHKIQGDKETSEHWQKLKANIVVLRLREK